jgi:hypothetical protein
LNNKSHLLNRNENGTSFYNNDSSHSDKNAFAQINFFMKLHVPSEELLNGIKLASINSYITEKDEVWNSAQVNKNTWGKYQSPAVEFIDFSKAYGNIRKNYRFVAFTDIFATQYGSFGLDNRNKPFRQESFPNYSEAVKTYFNPFFSKNNNGYNSIQKLYLLPLKPERLHIVYDKRNTDMYNE